MSLKNPAPFVFGASGFLGQHLIKAIGLDKCFPISRTGKPNETWMKGDLLDPSSFNTLLKPGATVFNLAYSDQCSSAENVSMANNLVEACIQAKASKIIHCSTALVVGNNPTPLVNEETMCLPETPYEKTKYEIEKIMLGAINHGIQVNIIRPTGVIGPGGKNLKKMLLDIRSRYSFLSLVRASLYGSMPLNLVSVTDVVRALIQLSNEPLSSGIYICSADEDPDNDYQQIEALIRACLKKIPHIKPIKLPKQILNTLSRVSRSGSRRFPNRRYSSQKLHATGFQRSVSISEAVKEFVLSEIN